MSIFSKDEVARLADLARIALTDEEIEQFAGELSMISDAMAKVSDVAASDIPPTSHPIPLTNVWREDVVTDEVLDLETVFGSAPAHEDGKFAVPQILGEE
ncbi:Asp-tRNA(Asn)/Glu-tRNA(Gln) amidotransferase subunit GatC [Trueperella pecoris]|uniref:Aspartyl/glutamyl-tRNA(Asn/Gln) amidotransferase subunit C n=1 Tax=Trueperella pecoris TaxID=2733571 RepID=A0A7M1QXF6_9ACTO|nr:Asp-tRNA(Asn)/Glu-tRNA(Gln) amidotransferase subunit GatC [Trueperella pecoris]QOQ39183.1 Asp-tRNA(Asn)/Glu-tRNA(Gln) amidotransferase subunit GatC [Trueperella pecoris]QOR46184.1 Asp-tRNA(Asn)/Glu-tRNA(Gln) amidotransferase subunit GatC [Trueperella pecoris]QOR48270.1 Asp-tRNA(Asn)/Glu-tRNA(Gln) amidotransferase subunit GatC [Trueperella pecoris]QTG76012.1 Asp-tRNA(Asn)/Glu-tRNA(Gln) amidotransferase subunit GatC [Trueperella pecoris]